MFFSITFCVLIVLQLSNCFPVFWSFSWSHSSPWENDGNAGELYRNIGGYGEWWEWWRTMRALKKDRRTMRTLENHNRSTVLVVLPGLQSMNSSNNSVFSYFSSVLIVQCAPKLVPRPWSSILHVLYVLPVPSAVPLATAGGSCSLCSQISMSAAMSCTGCSI